MIRRRRQPVDDRGTLLEHMLKTVEDERALIAHRLHDGPQQLLTAIRLLADGVRHAMEEGETAHAREGLDRLEQAAVEAGDELRQMTARLYPVVMEQLGLLQALGSLAETVEEEHEVRATAELPASWPAADDARDTAIYQVAREAALHAARSGATPITIRLTGGDPLVLRVVTPGCPPPGDAIRLLLHERAARIGGQIAISPGGEEVALTVPAGR
jgi:signal transduction histidine kinase